MIAVAVQKVPFRTPKAYLLARKSIAFETQNGTSGERDRKSFTNRGKIQQQGGKNKTTKTTTTTSTTYSRAEPQRTQRHLLL